MEAGECCDHGRVTALQAMVISIDPGGQEGRVQM